MLDDKFVPQFNITLRCNLYSHCKYCYAKEQTRTRPRDMAVDEFARVLGLFRGTGVDEAILLGGEPAMHPAFGQILEIGQQLGISSRLFTNGTFNETVADLVAGDAGIGTVFFHFDESYLGPSDPRRDRFHHNLAAVAESGKTTWLRWNIDRPDANGAEVIRLARRHSAAIGYSITVPTLHRADISIPRVREYVACLLRFVRAASDAGIRLEPGRAMPLCAFEDEEIDFLKTRANMSGTCSAINDITVNTDGTLQLCSVTHGITSEPPADLDDLRDKIDFLVRKEAELRATPAIPECADCASFGDGTCQGGCFAYHLYGRG